MSKRQKSIISKLDAKKVILYQKHDEWGCTGLFRHLRELPLSVRDKMYDAIRQAIALKLGLPELIVGASLKLDDQELADCWNSARVAVLGAPD